MREILLGALLFLWGVAGGADVSETQRENKQNNAITESLPEGSTMSELPLDVVNKRTELYNAYDLEGFLSLYDPEIAIYDYPDTFFGSGIDHMRGIFAPMFAEGKVHVRLLHQTASDSYVINEEIVTYPDDRGEVRYVSIYEVRNGKIKSVRFVRD